MALQSAASAKNASDTADIQTKSILTSLVMGVIDAVITTQSTRTDLDTRIYKATMTLRAAIDLNTGVVEVIQSDETKVLLVDLESALTDAGYNISCKSIKASRAGIDDKIKIQISWNRTI